MKKLNKIKLTVLNSNEIVDKEQRLLKGGGDYRCGCITACAEDACVCLDEGGSVPSEVSFSYHYSSLSGENLNKQIADDNYNNYYIP